jgi:hypothetical protein
MFKGGIAMKRLSNKAGVVIKSTSDNYNTKTQVQKGKDLRTK